jgi:hypothetical protein
MKNNFLFIFLVLLISCDDDANEVLQDVSSSTEYSDLNVFKANQLILEQNPFLTEDLDGLFHLQNKLEKAPISDGRSIEMQQVITAVIMVDSSCASMSNAVITYEGYKYKLYVTARYGSRFDRLVQVAISRGGFPFNVRTLTIPSRSFNSNPEPFIWISGGDLGPVSTEVIQVTELVPSNASVFPDGFNRVDTTANYNSIISVANIINCKPDYSGLGDFNTIELPDGSGNLGGNGGFPSTFDPCDCDGDGIKNDLDWDDNNNGFRDDFEIGWGGCDWYGEPNCD